MKGLLIVALCAGGTIAHADAGYIGDAPQRLDVDDCPALPAMTQEELLKLGGERYNRGEQLYTQGDYPGAVSELVLSYCTYPYYLLLKDIGQAYERELEYDKAIGYLQRYASQVPANAQKPNQCAADPKVDKDNVLRRIEVLRHLPGHVLVQADRVGPNGELAQVEIATATVTASAGKVGEQLGVERGHYQLVVRLDGYEAFTQEIDVEIGKPYTYFAKLDPLKGHVSLTTIPADARIFLDDKFVGIGRFASDLPAKTYKLSVESPGRITETRTLAVLPNKVIRQPVELYDAPQTGRYQAITYATVGTGVATAALLKGTNNDIAAAVGLIAGAGAGFFGSTYGLREDLPLGTSSLTITTSVFGAVLGAAAATLFSDKTTHIAPFGGLGAIGGAALGYVVGQQTSIRPGEAAVLNSSLVWGTAAGALFAVTFDPQPSTSAGLVLSGLAMGTVGGLLITKYFTVSRTHAALIDVGGLIGAIGGVALEGLLYPQKTGQTVQDIDQQTRERIANFALAGMAIGLITAGVITRDLDSPTIPFAPTIGSATAANGSTTTTFGIAAPW